MLDEGPWQLLKEAPWGGWGGAEGTGRNSGAGKKLAWQASWHCGSLVEAGVSRKSPTMAAQGTQGSRRHSQRWRRGRLGASLEESLLEESSEAASAGSALLAGTAEHGKGSLGLLFLRIIFFYPRIW